MTIFLEEKPQPHQLVKELMHILQVDPRLGVCAHLVQGFAGGCSVLACEIEPRLNVVERVVGRLEVRSPILDD